MISQLEFLEALRQRISLLERSEQEDILEEYAQHIALQVRDGRSEEEAIRDFGPVEELAAQILEAYHIDPAFREQPTGTESVPAEQSGRPRQLPGLWHRVQETARSVSAAGAPSRPTGEETGAAQTSPQQASFRDACRQRAGQAWQNLKHSGIWLWTRLKRLLLLLLWLGWNGGLALCALPVVALGLTAVVLLGTMLVLVTRGLPLIGVTVMVLGGLLVCGSLLGLGWTLIWHRKRKKTGKSAEKMEEEASHEGS